MMMTNFHFDVHPHTLYTVMYIYENNHHRLSHSRHFQIFAQQQQRE